MLKETLLFVPMDLEDRWKIEVILYVIVQSCIHLSLYIHGAEYTH